MTIPRPRELTAAEAAEAAAVNARLGTPELLAQRPLLAELREVSPIKAGWAARAHRWAVHAATIPGVLEEFERAAAMHAEIDARIRRPAANADLPSQIKRAGFPAVRSDPQINKNGV